MTKKEEDKLYFNMLEQLVSTKVAEQKELIKEIAVLKTKVEYLDESRKRNNGILATVIASVIILGFVALKEALWP